MKRYVWPKTLPALTDQERVISDDFMQHWLGVLRKRYEILETFNHTYPLRHLPQNARFRTIEFGAGLGKHLEYEDLSRQEYHCIEFRENVANELSRRSPEVSVKVADCQERLPFDDAYFDRALAIHVLEHLPDLPRAAKEIHRLIRSGGIISIVIPCDPGLLYEIARRISAERIFKRRYKMPYRWLVRREHINSPQEIIWVFDRLFRRIDHSYFPLRVPVISANLCIGLTYIRD